jgi:hypothetical protein|uniref:Nucleotidyltransferase family protein n=1 Tax=Desulfobacca acetoxidans TaxID=60893 RepID=A0A7V6DRA7_9BACT
MIFEDPLIPLVLDLGSGDPQVRLQAGRRLAQQLATPGFLDFLIFHRLTSLLYQTLTQFSRAEVGQVPLLEALRRDYLGGLRLYLAQEKETRQFVKVLVDAGVEVILLKGADIRYRVYEDPVCRPMNDLDVLISPADLDKARNALIKRGYALMPRDADLRPGFKARFGWVESFQPRAGESLGADVHWGIQEAGTFFRLPYKPLKALATARDLDGVPALVLAPEHVLMHLCLHTFDELENATLLKFTDLQRVLTRFSLNWDLFLDEAARFRLQAPILWIFQGIVRWRPHLVPEEVLRKLGAQRCGWAERSIIRRQANAKLIASVMALWRHVPVRAWPAYLGAKLWPSRQFLDLNAESFSGRADYLRHILGRAQDKT